MRVIEREMLSAIRNRRDWKKANTEVRIIGETDDCPIAKVYLHNNHIATYYYGSDYHDDHRVRVNKYTLYHWPTPTTKSRLRALDVDVYTRNWKTYLDGIELSKYIEVERRLNR